MEPIYYPIEDLDLILYPITIKSCVLDVEIDTSKNWYIQSVSMLTSVNSMMKLAHRDWIESAIIATVYANQDICNDIQKACRGEE